MKKLSILIMTLGLTLPQFILASEVDEFKYLSQAKNVSAPDFEGRLKKYLQLAQTTATYERKDISAELWHTLNTSNKSRNELVTSSLRDGTGTKFYTYEFEGEYRVEFIDAANKARHSQLVSNAEGAASAIARGQTTGLNQINLNHVMDETHLKKLFTSKHIIESPIYPDIIESFVDIIVKMDATDTRSAFFAKFLKENIQRVPQLQNPALLVNIFEKSFKEGNPYIIQGIFSSLEDLPTPPKDFLRSMTLEVLQNKFPHRSWKFYDPDVLARALKHASLQDIDVQMMERLRKDIVGNSFDGSSFTNFKARFIKDFEIIRYANEEVGNQILAESILPKYVDHIKGAIKLDRPYGGMNLFETQLKKDRTMKSILELAKDYDQKGFNAISPYDTAPERTELLKKWIVSQAPVCNKLMKKMK